MLRNQRNHCSPVAGFTIVELVIVVAIIGILTAVALPMYLDHIARSHRTAAKAALVDAAQNMERFFTRNNTYAGPAVSPDRTDGSTYLLSFVGVPDGSTFVIQAVPQGNQASDKCGTYTINQAGARTATKDGVDVTSSCW